MQKHKYQGKPGQEKRTAKFSQEKWSMLQGTQFKIIKIEFLSF